MKIVYVAGMPSSYSDRRREIVETDCSFAKGSAIYAARVILSIGTLPLCWLAGLFVCMGLLANCRYSGSGVLSFASKR